ncbi:2-dehydro-3-deoxygalactonokinase [Amaricoccus sp.]|uniref:2-dehydro-3-deoxygalactonokinase n=1 Tax=Amaricoccus sp. TaxID=1872485 RepID=UPI001B49B4D9|nr:2-dehydro-3-deoxygalactonokinase [Amaricoccus sp.]MBP7242463.1 2-dehydro-3-deoxygalactonokinase [Amaricoccus sp.]
MSPAPPDEAPDPARIAWIAADWGTSNLRAWAMDAHGLPLAEAGSGAGMGGLARDGFEPALVALVAPWLAADRRTDVLACGMVGARQGWIEAPYATVPCAPTGPAVEAPATDPRLRVRILPGLRQDGAWDVMRGEETQIAGLIADDPGFDGVACLPGTHTKWAHVSAGEVVSFASFMTGELFALVSTASVLRHSVATEGWSAPDFAEAVEETLARPERLAGRLFGIRAEGLLAGLAPERARARLSGLLIGAELAAARPYWLGRDVVLVGAPALARAYREALALAGVAAREADAAAMTRAGLAAAWTRLANTERRPA